LEEIKLEQARKDQTASFIGASQSQEDIEEIIRTCQENLHLYRELLEPVKMAVCQSDAIWAPKSIGVMGKMPWIHLYGDWLRILLDNIVGVAGHRHAMPTIDIER
jgi:hypothetical protein